MAKKTKESSAQIPSSPRKRGSSLYTLSKAKPLDPRSPIGVGDKLRGDDSSPAATAASRLTPRLQFSEFRKTNGWITTELRQFSEFVSERVCATECTPYTVTSGIGLVSQQEKLGRTIAGNSLKNYVILKKNDFAYNKSATKAFPQGFIARYIGEERAAVPNSIFTCFRVNEEVIDPTYLENFFASNRHGNWLRSRIAIGARAHGSLNVSDDDLMALPVPLPDGPTSIKEQQKIADCLTSLDDVIAAQGHKVEALKVHKRGLMQQLFPRAGETRPRLRFPEFRNAPEWKQKALGELADVLMCKRIFASETNSSGGVPFYKIGTLGGMPDAFISKELFDEYKARYNFPRVGEILITCSGTVGKCLAYNGRDAYFQDSNIVWIDNPTGEIGNEFLFALIANVDWGKLNSTTITRIYGPDLRALSVTFPKNHDEQQRIADCLSSLDTQITAESEKLATLKTHKRGLMQQLFPAPDGVAT